MADETREILLKLTLDTDDGEAKLEQVNESLEDTSKQADDSAGAFGNLGEAMQSANQVPIVQRLQAVIGGLKATKAGILANVGGLKGLRAAIIATGIGALIIGLTSLVTFLTQTQKGVELVNEGMAALGAFFDVIKDRISIVGGALFDFGRALVKVFKGEWTEAAEIAGQATDALAGSFRGVTDEIREEVQLARELSRAMEDLTKSENDQLLTTAKHRREIEKLKFEEQDFTKTVEERREAILRAAQIERQDLAERTALQRERVRIAQEEFDRGESLEADRKALIEEQVRLVELETESITKQTELQGKLNALNAEALAITKERADAEAKLAEEQDARLRAEFAAKQQLRDRDMEAEQRLTEIRLENDLREATSEQEKQAKEIELLEARTDYLLANEQLTALEREVIIEEHEQNVAEIKERYRTQEANREIAAQKQEAALRAQTEQQLTAIFQQAAQERGALGKAARILLKGQLIKETVMNTRAAAMGAYDALASIPYVGPYLGALAAAAVIAYGGYQVTQIAAQQFARGGRVKSGREIRGMPRNGDNTLALVQPGEVVLNKPQQRRLGGPAAFKAAGVPGFAAGGLVGSASATVSALTSQQAAAQNSLDNTLAEFDRLARSRPIYVGVKEFREVEDQVDIAASLGTIV